MELEKLLSIMEDEGVLHDGSEANKAMSEVSERTRFL